MEIEYAFVDSNHAIADEQTAFKAEQIFEFALWETFDALHKDIVIVDKYFHDNLT